MRNRFSRLIALAALLASSLACNLPTRLGGNNPTERMIVIDSLAVNPRESEGQNDLAVSFNYIPGTIDTVITCSVITPSGVEQKIWSAPFGKSTETTKYNADFAIRVDIPGNYTLHCWDSIGPASESTSFSITESTQPIATEVVFTSGGLWFTYENGVAGWCLPGVNNSEIGGTSSLDVNADGTLSGMCSMPYYGDGNMDSTLDGTWNKVTGQITFHLKTVLIYNSLVNKGTQYEESGNSTTTYEYEGRGEMTSENQAAGDAPYTITCTTTNPKAIGCTSQTKGTVHWQINFGP